MVSAAVALSTLCSPARRISNACSNRRKRRSPGGELHVARLHLAARSVADHAPVPVTQAGQQVLRAAIRGRGQQQPPAKRRMGAHAAHEALHGGQHRLAIGEEVGVIHLDVGDDRPGRVVVEEVVAELIGLHQERRSVAGPDGGSPWTDEGADLHGRVQPGADQQVPEQGGGGRLAVRAGHRQADPPSAVISSPSTACQVTIGRPALARRDQLGQVRDRPQRGRDGHALARPPGGRGRGRTGSGCRRPRAVACTARACRRRSRRPAARRDASAARPRRRRNRQSR